ncbi:flagellar basal body-associated protein [Opitutaceae bacterium TAV1]|nr:flagellar basal body-associated protein [Opitutaceae bacterium TAV1]
MAAKTDITADTQGSGEPARAGGSLSFRSWLPLLFALVLTPAVTWAVVQYVVMPQLRAGLFPDSSPASSAPVAGEGVKAPGWGSYGGAGRFGGPGAAGAAGSYTFENVIVNLAGTQGTRYLKVTFIVTGSDPELAATCEAKRPQLLDVTLNVLSSLSLADLEEAGARNLLREKLVTAINGAVGKRIAEQIWFSDFVVQ